MATRGVLVLLVAAILAAMALPQSPAASQTTSPATKASLGQIAAGGPFVAEWLNPSMPEKPRPATRLKPN